MRNLFQGVRLVTAMAVSFALVVLILPRLLAAREQTYFHGPK
jgi:hypothetical protein